jgi:GntR family galactonate operon transcriptional repressor
MQMNMKLQQNNLTQQFVHSFTDAIVRGQFATGESIPSEGEIAAMFGISRTIVREGIREISSLGLIIKHQGARSIVAPMKDWDMLNKNLLSTLLGVDEKRAEIIEGLFSFRLALECQAATEAAKHRTEADLENMQTQLAVMEKTINEPARFLAADSQMHRAIHEASHNIVFLSILKNIRDIMAIARDFTIAQPRGQFQAMQQHRDIVQHIKDRNPDGANVAMRHHILWAKEGSQSMQL